MRKGFGYSLHVLIDGKWVLAEHHGPFIRLMVDLGGGAIFPTSWPPIVDWRTERARLDALARSVGADVKGGEGTHGP